MRKICSENRDHYTGLELTGSCRAFRGWKPWPSTVPIASNNLAVKRLTPHRFRTILTKLKLTQVQAAHVLGVTARTARRYALGETPIPNPVAKLLLLMLQGVIDTKTVRTTLP